MAGMGAGGNPPPPMVCQGTPPATPLITDFADAVPGAPITFGSAVGQSGGTFTYAATGLAAPALSLVPAPSGAGQALHVVANPGTTTDPANSFFGFGLFFNSCVDASAFNGVRFTLTGDLGTCAVAFGANLSADLSAAIDPVHGACTAESCFSPSASVTAPGTVVVRFADVTGGNPVTVVDKTAIVGVEWHMATAADDTTCTGDFVISDVEFVTDATPPPPACAVFVPTTPQLTGSPATIAAPGATYTFAAPGLATPVVTPLYSSDLVWQATEAKAAPGIPADASNGWLGFGVPLLGCVDARGFTGVRFSVLGDLGTCALNFTLVSTDASGTQFGVGSGLLPVGTTTLHFSELTGDSTHPTVEPSRLNDVQWNLVAPSDGVSAACQAHLFVTDVAFVND